MKATVAVLAFLIAASASANRGRTEKGVETGPKDRVEAEQANKATRNKLEMAAKPHAEAVAEGQAVTAKASAISQQSLKWVDGEGKPDVVAQDNARTFTDRLLAEGDMAKRAELAVEMMAEKEGLNPKELTAEQKKELLKKLRECI